MTRQVLYVAHPLRPTSEESFRFAAHALTSPTRPDELATKENLQRALRWLAWLRRSFPETTFIAPWIASVMSGDDDSDPAQREAGLVDDCATIERCDGIVLCGGRISSGMRREMEHGIAADAARWAQLPSTLLDFAQQFGHRFQVYDLTRSMGANPPDPGWDLRPPKGCSFSRWHTECVELL